MVASHVKEDVVEHDYIQGPDGCSLKKVLCCHVVSSFACGALIGSYKEYRETVKKLERLSESFKHEEPLGATPCSSDTGANAKGVP